MRSCLRLPQDLDDHSIAIDAKILDPATQAIELPAQSPLSTYPSGSDRFPVRMLVETMDKVWLRRHRRAYEHEKPLQSE